MSFNHWDFRANLPPFPVSTTHIVGEGEPLFSNNPNFLAVVTNAEARRARSSGIQNFIFNFESPTERKEKREKAKETFKSVASGKLTTAIAFDDWLKNCSTPTEAREAFDATEKEDRLDKSFRLWLRLCSTPEEARAAYRATSNHGREELAKERIRELGGNI